MAVLAVALSLAFVAAARLLTVRPAAERTRVVAVIALEPPAGRSPVYSGGGFFGGVAIQDYSRYAGAQPQAPAAAALREVAGRRGLVVPTERPAWLPRRPPDAFDERGDERFFTDDPSVEPEPPDEAPPDGDGEEE